MSIKYKGQTIADAGGRSGGAYVEVYDEQERVIGTWFGKPLYRKGFSIDKNFDTGGKELADVADLNIEDIAKTYGTIVVLSNNAGIFSRSYPDPGIAIGMSEDKTKLMAWSNAAYTLQKLAIEYTKTTDNPAPAVS